jgi:predicted lipoprotein with Yx(FWY)xxD motif
MHTKRLIPGLLAAATLTLGLAACGGDDAAPAAAPVAEATEPAGPTAAAGQEVVVKAAQSPLGKILVGHDGMTLYGFTNDVDAKSTCSGACATAWPPAIVGPDWTVGPELDSGVFSTIVRDDGQTQLVAGRWPLYYYSGDSKAGEANGQGSGDVWFVVDTATKLVKDGAAVAAAPTTTAAPAPAPAATNVKTAATSLGTILVDANGMTLYGFTKDEAGTPTCNDACARAWPPSLLQGAPTAGAGIDPASVVAVPRADGSQQLKVGKWPLYLFSGDAAPGDVNGQGSGGVWFVVGADGKLIKGNGGSAAAPATAPAAPAAATETTKKY